MSDSVTTEELLWPEAAKVRAVHERRGYKFIHYTSAEAALSIIKNRQIWLRNATCMSDYREMLHGSEKIHSLITNEKLSSEFVSAFRDIDPEIPYHAFDLFSQVLRIFQASTFISCFSEYRSDRFDGRGRLSMWRAFGGVSRVALVFRPPTPKESVVPAGVFFGPVGYLEDHEVEEVFRRICGNIADHASVLKAREKDSLVNDVFWMFVAAVVGLKHPGFHEEREWRVMYLPTLWQNKNVVTESKVISGIPQNVCILPLNREADEEWKGLLFSKIFEKMIIGPTQFADAMAQAFADELTNAGVTDARDRISISRIPIRT